LNNYVEDNTGSGISTGFAGTIANNTSTYNNIGIEGGGQVTNNSVSFNTNDGIDVEDSGSSVIGNTLDQNGGFGIDAFGEASVSFGNNQIYLNNGENSTQMQKTTAQTRGGVQLSTNICDGNSTCPGP
jgi:parallel beta-helix repeat protein